MKTTIGDGVRARRVRAAPLTGRGWLNTGGEPLGLQQLRGRFVLLDFWTFCGVNCLHVLDELRDLEQKYRDVLVIVGVHSPKFPHEADPEALAEAVERYEVHHPVLDDPELTTWQAYTARAWPTLVLVDPEGYAVAHLSGEGHAAGLDALLSELIPVHEAAGTLHRGAGPYVPPPPSASALRYPGGLLRLPSGVLVSDTAHHQVVLLDGDDLTTELARYGTGERGLEDGERSQFSAPLGLAALPPEIAEQVGYDVVIADSTNHALRGLQLATGTVTTVAGTGRQLRLREGSGPAREQDLSTPWDVAWSTDQGDKLVVAMAGVHQLWSFNPVEGTIGVLAGTSHEGLVDGSYDEAWFAQPSGLSTAGDVLWVADSETSALRTVSAGRVETVIGAGLFDFGHRDGPAAQARLQHPLAVQALPDGSVAIADTYNGAIRRYAHDEVTTIAEGLTEPSALTLDGDTLLVAEGHQVTRIAIGAAARVERPAEHTARPPVELAPGAVRIVVRFTPPPGQKLDTSFGDPLWTSISATPEPVSGAGREAGLERTVGLATDGTLHISAQAAACDLDAEGAACHLYQQDWGVPYRLTPSGSTTLTLDLATR